MKRCKCGNQCAPNARTCPKCGHRFTSGLTKFVAWTFGIFLGLGVLGAIIGSIGNDSPTPPQANRTPPSPTSPQAKAEQDIATAIQLCKQESIHREHALGSGYVANGYEVESKNPETLHVQVKWGLGGPAYVALSDCQAVRKNNKVELTHVKLVTGENAAQYEKEGKQTGQKTQAQKDTDLDSAIAGALRLQGSMRNPDSFKLEEVLIMGNGTVCYRYRAENGFGGMNREYAVLTPKGRLTTNDSDQWNRLCAHKSGDNQTDNVNGFVRAFSH